VISFQSSVSEKRKDNAETQSTPSNHREEKKKNEHRGHREQGRRNSRRLAVKHTDTGLSNPSFHAVNFELSTVNFIHGT
jgi:hypothetical protein